MQLGEGGVFDLRGSKAQSRAVVTVQGGKVASCAVQVMPSHLSLLERRRLELTWFL